MKDLLVLCRSPDAVQMGKADFLDFLLFGRGLHLPSKLPNLISTDFTTPAGDRRGTETEEWMDGERERHFHTTTVSLSLIPLQRELSAAAVRVAINKKCFLP